MGFPLMAHAQSDLPNPIQMSFAIPTVVDPAQLFLFAPGQSYTHTNDQNGNTTGLITGATLISGLEIHGAFPGAAPIPVGEIDFSIPYLGALTLTPTNDPRILDPHTGNPYLPWLAIDDGIQNGLHSFTLRPQAGSAQLDQNDFYGVLSANTTGVDTGSISDFTAAGFSSTGFTSDTPEPGAGALLLGAVFSGGLVAVRRRKPRKSA